MTEWILLITLHITGATGMGDISVEAVSGFTTKEHCESAGRSLGIQLVGQVGKHREHEKIPGNTRYRAPVVNTSCTPVQK